MMSINDSIEPAVVLAQSAQAPVSTSQGTAKMKKKSPHRVPPELQDLSSSERLALLKDLANILTVTEEAAQLIMEFYPHDALRLRAAFSQETAEFGEQSRNWRMFTMALLPIKSCQDVSQGVFRIQPNSNDTLRLLSTREPEQEISKRHLNLRRTLCNAVSDNLLDRTYKTYKSIVAWDNTSAKTSEQPNNSDLAVMHAIHALETLFFTERSFQERRVRMDLRLDDSEPTPSHQQEVMANGAAHYVQQWLKSWGVISADLSSECEPHDTNVDEGIRDDLILRVLCNIGANRVLLERACIADLSERALKPNLALVQALNRNGIDTVPVDINSDDDIRRVLTKWLGSGGQLARDPLLGKRQLKGQDMEVLMTQIDNLQHYYLSTHGAYGVHQHVYPVNRFYFALALAAGYFSGVKLPGEFKPTKIITAFPPRNLGWQARSEKPGHHALELFAAMYGQLYFGNSPRRTEIPEDLAEMLQKPTHIDTLRAECMSDYVQGMAHQRQHLLFLIFIVFKRLHPAQILRLSEKTQYLVKEFQANEKHWPKEYCQIPEEQRSHSWFIHRAVIWHLHNTPCPAMNG